VAYLIFNLLCATIGSRGGKKMAKPLSVLSAQLRGDWARLSQLGKIGAQVRQKKREKIKKDLEEQKEILKELDLLKHKRSFKQIAREANEHLCPVN